MMGLMGKKSRDVRHGLQRCGHKDLFFDTLKPLCQVWLGSTSTLETFKFKTSFNFPEIFKKKLD